jgi:hypothetical protein
VREDPRDETNEQQHDEPAARVDRRRLLRAGLFAGAVVGVPAFVGRATASGRSPFDSPFGVRVPAADANRRRRRRRRGAAPPATILRRAEWRADEALRSREIDFDDTVEKIVVHHTGTNGDASDWPQAVRDVYRSTVARGYRDIPYHWLIDPDGVVYEGRWAGPKPRGAAPDGEDRRGRSVRGGHAKGHNDRTIGIALLGSYDRRPPSRDALDALIALVAWKCDRWGIDPMGATPYRRRDGVDEVIPNICPHGRVRATACPGREVLDLLPVLRVAVAQRLA